MSLPTGEATTQKGEVEASLSDALVPYVRQWWEQAPEGGYLFPPCSIRGEDAYKFGHVIWKKPMERRFVNNVIKRYFRNRVALRDIGWDRDGGTR